jgi:DNA-binding winged helix-turn-helix (wHTH) protein/tetratricopeptide (TPR) repeat protein
MSAAAQWHFGAFRLDPAHACLWRGDDVLVLPPKPFAVLHYLVTHPNRLVTKAELLAAVWPETAITDAAMRVAIGAVRKVLGDTAPTPRYIATVPHRGYRFLAPVTMANAAATLALSPPLPGVSSPLLVERETVLLQLQRALVDTQQGTRQMVFLTGEPGIGKTAVVETFIAQAATRPPLWVGHGQCVEHFGPGEAYLPILEILGDLCRGPGGARLVALLRQQAPTWVAQMPWLLTAVQRVQVHNELQGATRERMLREGAEVLETLTAEQPMVLVLEDLHWSDTATVDLLVLLARRRTPARLLVLGTYRPGDVLMYHHPLQTIMPDLQRYGAATEIPLAELSAAAVYIYLTARCPQHQFPSTLAAWLHQRTDGNPLFLVTLVEALVEQGVLYTHNGRWTLQGEVAAVAGDVPESLRRLLVQQVTRLAQEAQRVLEGASAAGVEFAAAAVAAGLDTAAEVVEEHCEALVSQQLLRPLGITTWPNGIVATRYAFRHALYQQAVYARLGAGQRVRLHQRLAACLEAVYGEQTGEIAAELAEHFARGANAPKAVHYFHQAAAKATQRYAHREVTHLVTRALALLRQLPETPERAQHELDLHMTLGPALAAIKGHTAPEVQQTYSRAYMLCHQVPESPQLPQTLVGLWLFYSGCGDHATAQAMGRHLLRLAQRFDDPVALLYAHGTLGLTAFYLGDVVAERVHLEHGITLDERLTPYPLALGSLCDFGVVCRIGAAGALQQLGYPDQARQREEEALALTQRMASPYNRCNLLLFLALVHLFRREGRRAQQWVEEGLSLATARGFLLLAALGTIVLGATLTAQGQAQAGLAHIRQGLAACHTLGTKQLQPWALAMLAESYARLRQPEAGLTVLAETSALMATTGDMFYAAEIARLQGELCLQAGSQAPDIGLDMSSTAAAERCFQHALKVAQSRQARWWELRAAVSLARLWQQQGKRAEAYKLLAPVYHWFTEGFDTTDLQEAKALLEALA